MSSVKVWALQVGINDYNQWGEYTVALFNKRPSMEALLKACSEGFGDFGTPRVEKLSLVEALERLLEQGYIEEIPRNGGGDKWYLMEMEVLNG